MKKFLLAILMTGLILAANSVSAATYTTYFDDNAGWYTSQGSWGLTQNPLNPTDPTDLIYRGTPTDTEMASSYLWNTTAGITNNIPTSNLQLHVVTGLPTAETITADGVSSGAFFGSTGAGTSHSIFLHQAQNNNLYFCFDDSLTIGITDYVAELGNVGTDFTSSDVFFIGITIDAAGSLSWRVTLRESDGTYDYANSPYSESNAVSVSQKTGIMGVFNQNGTNSFGYFSVTSPVPVPGTFALLGFGLVGLAAARRRP